MKPINDEDLEIFDLAEDAPQIAGIIDERPEEIRVMSEYRSTKKWKIVTDEFGIEDLKITAIDRRKSDAGSPKREQEISIKIRKQSDSNESPPRKKVSEIKKEVDSDASPPRKRKEETLRKAIKKEKSDSDASPPRKSRKEESDSDASPPRKSSRKERDASPPRRRLAKDDSDASPPPRRRRQEREDSDPSPPRRRNQRSDSDESPPRRRKHNDDSDASPPRRKYSSYNKKRESYRERDRSKERRKRSRSPTHGETSGRSKKDKEYGLKVLKNSEGEIKKEKKSSQLEKTLSGKKAGLQSADDMRKEGEKLKQKEREMFEKMSDEVTGRHAEAIVRNRKTGRRFDAKEEARKRREKEEKEAEKIAQYAVWGKGVKQVTDRQDKINDELYEMSKPLARYRDDKDLEEMLKNQEREGDPMLEYIRKKREAEAGPSKPQYEGSYMPNRYNIKPGHKWDGVDRSNGYEKKWFEEQNARKAREEEAFKWSTEDM
ncbi:hypothetical protein RUM43_008630 [Polyplax serrata]|uniref:BUD13 homolog n=1 Tax=Polyplax serrata TaxID=468196 RepID=A0AAN8S846_POLSC